MGFYGVITRSEPFEAGVYIYRNDIRSLFCPFFIPIHMYISNYLILVTSTMLQTKERDFCPQNLELSLQIIFYDSNLYIGMGVVKTNSLYIRHRS